MIRNRARKNYIHFKGSISLLKKMLKKRDKLLKPIEVIEINLMTGMKW
jgi:cobalamin-dependent methionine synthase I